jgi:hypothetical protein
MGPILYMLWLYFCSMYIKPHPLHTCLFSYLHIFLQSEYDNVLFHMETWWLSRGSVGNIFLYWERNGCHSQWQQFINKSFTNKKLASNGTFWSWPTRNSNSWTADMITDVMIWPCIFQRSQLSLEHHQCSRFKSKYRSRLDVTPEMRCALLATPPDFEKLQRDMNQATPISLVVVRRNIVNRKLV